MIHLYKEGFVPKNGLNLYSLFDKRSFGGVFRWNNKVLRFRYSKLRHKWFISKVIFDE